VDREAVEEITRDFRQQMGLLREAVHSRTSELLAGQDGLAASLDELRSQASRSFVELRTLFRLTHGALDGRISALESDMRDVKMRLARVESRTGS